MIFFLNNDSTGQTKNFIERVLMSVIMKEAGWVQSSWQTQKYKG